MAIAIKRYFVILKMWKKNEEIMEQNKECYDRDIQISRIIKKVKIIDKHYFSVKNYKYVVFELDGCVLKTIGKGNTYTAVSDVECK